MTGVVFVTLFTRNSATSVFIFIRLNIYLAYNDQPTRSTLIVKSRESKDLETSCRSKQGSFSVKYQQNMVCNSKPYRLLYSPLVTREL